MTLPNGRSPSTDRWTRGSDVGRMSLASPFPLVGRPRTQRHVRAFRFDHNSGAGVANGRHSRHARGSAKREADAGHDRQTRREGSTCGDAMNARQLRHDEPHGLDARTRGRHEGPPRDVRKERTTFFNLLKVPSRGFRDEAFVYGSGTAWVSVAKVRVPAFVQVPAQYSSNSNAGDGFGGAVMSIWNLLSLVRLAKWRWMDHDRGDRWRLMVFLTTTRVTLRKRVVLVEFFETRDAADRRRSELLDHWSERSWGDMPGIDRHQRRWMRQTSR